MSQLSELKKINEKLADAETNDEDRETLLTTIETNTSNTATNVTTVNTTLGTTNTWLSSIDSRNSDMKSELESIDNLISAGNGKLDTIISQTDGLESLVGIVATNTANTEDAVDNLRNSGLTEFDILEWDGTDQYIVGDTTNFDEYAYYQNTSGSTQKIIALGVNIKMDPSGTMTTDRLANATGNTSLLRIGTSTTNNDGTFNDDRVYLMNMNLASFYKGIIGDWIGFEIPYKAELANNSYLKARLRGTYPTTNEFCIWYQLEG